MTPQPFGIDKVAKVLFCSTVTGTGAPPAGGHAGLFIQYPGEGQAYIFERLVKFDTGDGTWRSELPVHIGDQYGTDDGKVFNVYAVALTATQASTIPVAEVDSFPQLPGPELDSTFVRRLPGHGLC